MTPSSNHCFTSLLNPPVPRWWFPSQLHRHDRPPQGLLPTCRSEPLCWTCISADICASFQKQCLFSSFHVLELKHPQSVLAMFLWTNREQELTVSHVFLALIHWSIRNLDTIWNVWCVCLLIWPVFCKPNIAKSWKYEFLTIVAQLANRRLAVLLALRYTKAGCRSAKFLLALWCYLQVMRSIKTARGMCSRRGTLECFVS